MTPLGPINGEVNILHCAKRVVTSDIFKIITIATLIIGGLALVYTNHLKGDVGKTVNVLGYGSLVVGICGIYTLIPTEEHRRAQGQRTFFD